MKKTPFHFLRGCVMAAILICAMPGTVRAGLVGYWSLDGDTDADAGGWGASTVVAGTNGENDISYSTDVPAAIASRVSRSLAFDANNDDRVVTAFHAGTAGVSGTPAATISYWIKRSSGTATFKGLLYLGGPIADPGTLISMERTGTDDLAAFYFNGNRISDGGFAADQWIHVVLTYEDDYGSSQMYFNGVNVSGTTFNPTNVLNLPVDATFTLGDRANGSAPANAFQMAELAVWDRVLSQSEITNLANGFDPTEALFRDCDGDGIDDRTQLISSVTQTLVFYPLDTYPFPIGDKVTIASPPLSGGNVTIVLGFNFDQWVDDVNDPDKYLVVHVNGTVVGRAFEEAGGNTIVIPLATWNALAGGSDEVEIWVEFGPNIVPPPLGSEIGNSYLHLTYTVNRDVDGNGWLDDCFPYGNPEGPDSDGDGVSDGIDRSPNTIADPSLVDAFGRLLRVARFDADEDGDVDITDLDRLDADVRDVNGDGDFDLHDLASILHGARGPGVASDPAFLQELALFKAHTYRPDDIPLATRPLVGISSTSYENANALCAAIYGTRLASIDQAMTTTSLAPTQQIARLHELVVASGSPMSWIGLKYSRVHTHFVWENGQLLNNSMVMELGLWGGTGGQIPGSGFFTPGQDDYCVFTYDPVYVTGNGVGNATNYQWINADCITASLGETTILEGGFVAQLPENTVPAALTTSTEIVTVTLASSLDGRTVVPGQTIDWTISFEVSSNDNSGLALLVTDLAQDPGNPATFDLPAGAAALDAMTNFALPLGFTGPGGHGGQPVGTSGALDLAEIGGAQNTLGGTSTNTSHGQGTNVVSGIGQSGSTRLATGSFTAPVTVGIYTFNLSNTIASVLKSVGGAGEGSEIVPANVTLAQSSISIEVGTPPLITLLGDNPVTHEAGTPYTDAGATAVDAQDGDLSGSIVVSNGVDAGALGSYSVVYNVTDSSGLPAAEVTRTVNVVDSTAPVITLLGSNTLTIELGEVFSDPGATALDSFEGDLTASISVSGGVDNLVRGTNVLTYNVADGSGNAAATVTRSVVVVGNEPPFFSDSTVSVTVDETTTGVVFRAAADDPNGGVRFDHPGYVALFLTDEGTGAGAADSLGSGLNLSFNAARWKVEPGAPGGDNVLNTKPQILPGDRSWFTVDNFNVTNGLTVSEWLRFDNLQTSIYDPVIWKFGDMRVVDYNGRLSTVGPDTISVASPFVDGEWAHLIFSIDPDGNCTFYLNGAEILSGQISFDNTLTGNTFGHDWVTTLDGINGARSDLSIIDGVLSPTQAELLYQSALHGHQGDVLRYSLGTAGDEAFFAIDAFTGELSLTSAVHFETPGDANGDNVYLVEVIATDAEGLSSSQIVEVTINNTNIAPVITGALLDPIEEVSGYYVYDFTVADDQPGDLTFQVTDNRFIVSPDGAGGYRVHRQNFHHFDYETLQSYDFDLIVSDGVEDARARIAFTLVNINDNAPVVTFTNAGPVMENDFGAVLGVFTITDADGDETFSFFDLGDIRFEIAPDGRTLKLKDGAAIDYEVQTSLMVSVIVSDGLNEGFHESTIAVLNVNDVAPHDLQLSGLEVSENDAGATIGTLSAMDEDGPALTYSASDARFEVQGNVLKLADGVTLDREATPSVLLTLTASDGMFEGLQDFTITVLNIDEGAPQNMALSNASIAENTTGIIGQLSATDVDGDAITFSVTDGRFRVAGNTLELITALNFENIPGGTVALAVTASGGGASTVATLSIAIEDVNEAPKVTLTVGTAASGLTGQVPVPVLENVRQATYAASGAPNETRHPLSFVANDVDGDALSYVLGGADAAAFTVDAATGALLFVTPADFENPGDADSNGRYDITISVTDGELVGNTITLRLTLLDTVEAPYDVWIAGYIPGETDPAIIGPDAAPSGTGLRNALSFAFNASPLDPSPTPLAQASVGGTVHAFQFAHRREAVAFAPVIGYSTNLGTSTSVSVPTVDTAVAPGMQIVVTTDGVGPGIDLVSFRVDQTLFPRFFAWLSVTIP